MDDPENPPPPPRDFKVLGGRGGASKRAKHGATHSITRDLYDAAAEIYLRGDRTINGLARAVNLDPSTAKRLIQRGYPDKGWPPLSERAALYDRQKVEAESKAHADAVARNLDQRDRARQERHAILRFTKAGYSNLIRAWQEKTKPATADGQPHDMTPREMTSLALTGERLMNGFAKFREMEEVDLGLMAESKDLPAEGGLASLAGVRAEDLGVTMEQLEFIANNGGQLPKDLSPEVIYGRRATGGERPK